MVVQIIGRKEVETNPNRVYVEKPDGIYSFPKHIDHFQTKAKIKPENYALVQEGDQEDYAISMMWGFNSFQFIPTNVKVLQSGLFVPTPSIFMPHYKNVNDTLQGKSVLYDAAGNLIEGKRLNDYANVINHNCWVVLNARFPKGKGFLGLDLVTITGLDKKGRPILKREHLEDCLEEDCFAELESTNSQGFLTKKAKVQEYEPGKTVYFVYPRLDSVARFVADSDRASLSYSWDPRDSYAGLGVFPCAVGA
ncbi:MAG: hypothetical protein AABX29_00995 [Nanoarchaeota archaeon]